MTALTGGKEMSSDAAGISRATVCM